MYYSYILANCSDVLVLARIHFMYLASVVCLDLSLINHIDAHISSETRDFTSVLLILISLPFASNLGRIDSEGRVGRIHGFPEILFLSMVLPLLVFPGFIGKLGILSGSRRGNRRKTFSSGFVPTIYRSQGLDFVCSNVSGLTSSKELEIGFPHVETWL